MKQRSFTGFMLDVINELQEEERFSTAHVYEYALRAVVDFAGGNLFFNGLTRQWLQRFQRHLEERQLSYNTISTYVRMIRAVYNRAVDRKMIVGEYRLFTGMKTGVASERKLALTAKQMHTLLDVSRHEVCNNDSSDSFPAEVHTAQDMLSLMLFLQGIPFVDLAHLRKSDLNDDLLTCRRQKTGTELCVKLLSGAKLLIERYRSRDERSPYLLNLLSGTTSGEDAYVEYQSRLRELNRNLARLSLCCNLSNIKVSSYTARHTWATLAKYCEIPEEIISEGLGHSSLNVTRTYLKSFEGDKLAKANRIIMDYIFSGTKTEWSRG